MTFMDQNNFDYHKKENVENIKIEMKQLTRYGAYTKMKEVSVEIFHDITTTNSFKEDN